MKTFYIFQVVKDDLIFKEKFTGSVDDARDRIRDAGYMDGNYLVLEDTSGTIVRETSKPETKLTFEPSRKRSRKAVAQ